MAFLPHIPPEQMTFRARLYLMATTLYCFGIGSACAIVPGRFTSSSFTQIKLMMPGGLATWALVHLIVGVLAGWAGWRGNERFAFRALMGATIIIGPWAAGFWIAFLTDNSVAPTGVAAYSFITLVHLIQARQPLRSPFDPVLRSLPGS